MKLVLIQPNEKREAEFIEDMLTALFSARRKYADQSDHMMYAVLSDAARAIGIEYVYAQHETREIFTLQNQCVKVAVMAMRLLFDSGYLEQEPERMADFFDDQFPDLQMTTEEKDELVKLAEKETYENSRCKTGLVGRNGECITCGAAQGEHCRFEGAKVYTAKHGAGLVSEPAFTISAGAWPLDAEIACAQCNGTGYSGERETCFVCNGTGKVTI